jgi:hypothetical protein
MFRVFVGEPEPLTRCGNQDNGQCELRRGTFLAALCAVLLRIIYRADFREYT